MFGRNLMLAAARNVQASFFTPQLSQLSSQSLRHTSRRYMSAHKMSKKARAELAALEATRATNLKYTKEESTFNTAALLTQYDVSLANKLRVAEKIIRPKPRTPSKRHLVRIDRSDLWKGRPIRSLTFTRRRNGGRNNHGRVTTRGRGGGTRRRHRVIDYKRSILDLPATVERLEYDPNRSCHIALVKYPDNRQAYILAQQGVSPGDVLHASRRHALDLSPGNAMALKHIPIGTMISCVELQPGHGPQLARSAGVSCELISKSNAARKGFGLLKLTSGEVRLTSLDCLAVVGSMSNPLFHIRSLGKAGRKRWMGIRPISRGLARNPVDHPHGGGAGQGRCGRPSISFSGVLAKGYKTRSINKPSPFIYMTRHAARAKAKAAQ
jgi:large subunit ribosomal protein L2